MERPTNTVTTPTGGNNPVTAGWAVASINLATRNETIAMTKKGIAGPNTLFDASGNGFTTKLEGSTILEPDSRAVLSPSAEVFSCSSSDNRASITVTRSGKRSRSIRVRICLSCVLSHFEKSGESIVFHSEGNTCSRDREVIVQRCGVKHFDHVMKTRKSASKLKQLQKTTSRQKAPGLVLR